MKLQFDETTSSLPEETDVDAFAEEDPYNERNAMFQDDEEP